MTSESLEAEIERLKAELEVAKTTPYRRKLPRERPSINHKVVIAGHDVYIIVSFFDDGQPGEIFFRIAKEGSTLYGLLDCFAISTSLALQWGTPFESLADKFIGQSFEPQGVTSNADIEMAHSIIDYTFRWLRTKVAPSAKSEPERVWDTT